MSFAEFDKCGVPMEQALNADQCAKVRSFLRMLTLKADTAKAQGAEIDVGKFLTEYRKILNGKRNNQHRTTWTDEKVAKAVRLRNQGLSWDKIAKEFNSSRAAVMASVGRYRKRA